MVDNPYYHRTAIRDSSLLFGRVVETRRVLTLVTKGTSVSIVGPRRIGKSSLLLHLCDIEVRDEYGAVDDVFVYIDCQRLSGDLSKSDVYRKLLDRAVKAKPGVQSVTDDSEKPMTALGLEERLEEIAGDGRIVLLFDEFEVIAGNRRLGKDFFDEMRGLGQAGKVVYVTASEETLFDLSFHDESILSSPFFNIFYIMWLGFLESHEARDLVDGLTATVGCEGFFDENDHTFLQRIAGFHPFYLQVACYHLFEEKMKGEGPSDPDYDLVKRQFTREMRTHFRYTWEHLSNDEQEKLKLICEDRADAVAREDMERLERKCVVYRREIFSSAFAEFVSQERERVPQLTSEDYLYAADRLGQILERLGRKEARLNFSIWNRRLREAIGSEEEAITQLDRLARQQLGKSFLELAIETVKH